MTALLLFDGECRFSSTCARLIQGSVRPDCIVVPHQHVDLAAWRVSREQVAADLVLVRRHKGLSQVVTGLPALASVLRMGRAPWPIVGSVLGSPLGQLARPVYRAVVDHRHRLPGGTPACDLDRAEEPVEA